MIQKATVLVMFLLLGHMAFAKMHEDLGSTRFTFLSSLSEAETDLLSLSDLAQREALAGVVVESREGTFVSHFTELESPQVVLENLDATFEALGYKELPDMEKIFAEVEDQGTSDFSVQVASAASILRQAGLKVKGRDKDFAHLGEAQASRLAAKIKNSGWVKLKGYKNCFKVGMGGKEGARVIALREDGTFSLVWGSNQHKDYDLAIKKMCRGN